MTRLLSLMPAFCLFCACGASSPEPQQNPAARQPNIILILADDIGWTDLASYGSEYYETPFIDELARQGMKFTDAYASASQCAPTRACLISGRDTPHHGIWAVSRIRGLEKFRKMVPPPNETRLPLGEVTLADAMHAAGYRTGMYGKWHLGTDDDAYLPSKRGFEEAITFPDLYRYFGFTTNPPMDIAPGTYLTDFLTDQALGFIEKNQARPFFLYLPHFAVHSPIVAKQDLIAKYEKKDPVGGHRDPVYAAMIESLDESVGRIMAKVDELDLSENTVVIFYSDNGGAGGYERDGIEWFSPTSNVPLRGGKGMLYEGGVRVPLVVRWPGVVEPGTQCNQPVTSTDFFPTFLELAGREAEALLPPEHKLDGVSMVPLLKNPTASLKREAIYWHYPSYLQAVVEDGSWRITPSGAIRSGDYKLIEFFEDGRLELYNLENDLGEETNLAQQMPDKARELHEKLLAWRTRTNAPMPEMKSDSE